jgi:gliding motility-associated-like protein
MNNPKIFIFSFFLIFLPAKEFLYAQISQQHSGNLEFIENKNQWEKNILYKADIASGAVFLEKNCFTFVFKDIAAIDKLHEFKHTPREKCEQLTPADYIIKYHAYKIKFLNALPEVKISANAPFEGYYNYYTGNDKNKWASKVKSYNKVEYTDLYEKTDLNIYENNLQLKYDIILHPGANAGNIQFLYEGADKLYIRNNNLVVNTSVNTITELSPEAFQIAEGKKIKVPCKFSLIDNVLSFVFPDGYDRSKELIIDPTLIFSTYSGSTADNWGFTATFDSSGCAYSGGIAFGTGYPVTTGAFQVNFAGGDPGSYSGGCDVAIIKYNPTGTQRLWATYLGGSKNELPHSMIVNNLNQLVIYGTTGSSNFPVTSGSYDQSFNGGDAVLYDNSIEFGQGIDIFVSKLSSDGTQLLASTYVGGSKNDGLNFPSILSYNYGDGARGEIMTDNNNNVYVVSTTNSTDFPVTPGAFQTTTGGGGQDGVVFKMDPNLSNMIWSSYIGGSGADAVYGIVLDTNDDVYVTGGTSSINFPTTSGTLHTNYLGGNSDGFITKISANGSSILKSTYYGSDAYDQSYLIEHGPTGKIYVFGQTAKTGSAFIYNATWAKPSGGQFVSKIEPDLSTLIWSTAFGTGSGVPDISPDAFLVDDCHNIYLSGWGGPNINGFGGTSGLPITSNAFQSTTDDNDFYFLVIDDNASSMIYGSFFGSPHAGEHVDGGTSRYDRKGVIYQGVCGGCGGWSDFPTTPGAWSNTNNSTNCNNAVIKFDFQLAGVVTTANAAPNDTGCVPFIVNFTSTSNCVNYHWDFDDPTSGANNNSTLQNLSHTFNYQGTYHIIFVAIDSSKCNISDTASLTIVVDPVPVVDLGTDTTLCSGNSISLDAGNPGFVYLWSTGATTQTITVADSGKYWVNVKSGPCGKSDTVNIHKKANLTYIVPNVFTPNNDGLNDVFKIKSDELTSFEGKLYNRWGKFIYTWTEPLKGWDGKIKGNDAPDGVYFYVLNFKNECGEKEVHGFVTLLR